MIDKAIFAPIVGLTVSGISCADGDEGSYAALHLSDGTSFIVGIEYGGMGNSDGLVLAPASDIQHNFLDVYQRDLGLISQAEFERGIAAKKQIAAEKARAAKKRRLEKAKKLVQELEREIEEPAP